MTTVSTLAQFTAAVNEKNTAPAIVVVKGVITGDAKVRIASNKTIIGLPGAGTPSCPMPGRRWVNTLLTSTFADDYQGSTAWACTSGASKT